MQPLLPPPPAHVAPYVSVLGTADAVTFFLTFGGAELYLAANPKGRSRLAALIGAERASALARISERLPARVPTAKPWIAAVWASEGLPKSEIARRLHVSDVTVRGWLKRPAANAVPDPRQPRLL
jgi:DNA-binding transcriptional regulator YiaG